MIRVRTGRGWRLNPQLLAELRAGGDRAVRHPPIVDVLGVEVDGVDLLADLAEDRIVEVTADLAAAAARLATGHRRAQVGLSAGQVELLLERDDRALALTLVRRRPPSAVLRRGLAIELSQFADAVRSSGQALLDELRRLNPDLAAGPAARRLAGALGHALSHKPRPLRGDAALRPLHGQAIARRRGGGQRRHFGGGGQPGFRIELATEVPDALSSYGGGGADLAALLVGGSLLWEPGGELPPFRTRGPPFLVIADLVAAGLSMLRALEQGDEEHELPLDGELLLSFRHLSKEFEERRDLRPSVVDAAARTDVRPLSAAAPEAAYLREASRGRPSGRLDYRPCAPVPLLASLFEAARAFGDLAIAACPRQANNPPLAALLTEAHEGLARCRELAMVGDGADAQRLAPLPLSSPLASPSAAEPKLGPGRLKVLTYRLAWESRAAGAVRRLTNLPAQRRGAVLLVEGEGGAVGLAADGSVIWQVEGQGVRAVSGAVPGRRGASLVALGHTLRRLGPAGGPASWETALWPVASGAEVQTLASAPAWGRTPRALPAAEPALKPSALVVAASDREVVGVELERGETQWRFSPAGGHRLGVAVARGRVLVTTSDQRLYGLGLVGGELSWRSRGRPLPGHPLCGEWLLTQGAPGGELVGVSLQSGRRRLLADVEASAVGGALAWAGGLVLAALRGQAGVLFGLRLRAGQSNAHPQAFKVAWTLEGGRELPLGDGLPLLVPLPEGVLVRSGRLLLRLDRRGRLVWSHRLSEATHGGLAPVHRRGVVIAAGDAGLLAFDAERGALLGSVDTAQPLTAFAVDGRLNVHLATEDGPLRAQQVQRFLSVV